MTSRAPKYFSTLDKGGSLTAKSNKLVIQVPELMEEAPAPATEKNNSAIIIGRSVQSNAKIIVKSSYTPTTPPSKLSQTSYQPRAAKSANGSPKSSKESTPKPRSPAATKQEIHKSPTSYVFPSKANSLITKGKIKPTSRTPKSSAMKPNKFTYTETEPRDSVKSRPSTTTNASSKSTLFKRDPVSFDNSENLHQIVTQVSNPKLSVKQKKEQEMTPSEIQARSEILYREHLFQTFQALKFVRNIPPANMDIVRSKKVNLARRRGYEDKKTIVFDLDETLVHCCEDLDLSEPDVILPIQFPSGDMIHAGINVRPFAIECLQEANKDFEVIVFTASHKCYADVVLDFLDPTHELIHHRLYRDNCIMVEGVYIKDLRIIANRRLKDIVMVDNAAYSFAYQLDNGIPIISWHNDYHDRELYNLIDYIKALATTDDIRDINRQTFHLITFYEDYISEFLSYDEEEAYRLSTGLTAKTRA